RQIALRNEIAKDRLILLPGRHRNRSLHEPALGNPDKGGDVSSQGTDLTVVEIDGLVVNPGCDVYGHSSHEESDHRVIGSSGHRKTEPGSDGPMIRWTDDPIYRLDLQRHFLNTNLNRLNGYVVARSIQHWAFPLANPSLKKIPAKNVVVLLILQHNRAVAPFGRAVEHGLVPLEQVFVVGKTALENPVCVMT